MVRYLAEEMSPPPSRRAKHAVSLALAVLVIAAYAGVARNGFINLDDNDYVTQNPYVQQGLTWKGIRWAFTTGHSANWHPLTWLSHMLDCQLAGTTPELPHLVNLGLHVASTVLLFRLFLRATSSIGPSAFVAAVFGLHPLHVESVAWIAERKDVLSAFFGILTMQAWVAWVEKPSAGRRIAVAVLYALGLLAKPMLVTLPFVLLLLDHWPLRRGRALVSLALEKADLLALAAASSVTTFLVQRAAGAMSLSERVPFGLRAENALVSYATYLGRSLVPVDLAVYYPHPASSYPAGRVILGAVVVVGLSVIAWLAARPRPWIPVGWLWFVGMLVPVIGLVQVGSQAMADRYAYLPMIGLSIAIGFEAAELAKRAPAARVAATTLGVLAVLAWAWLTRIQVGYWRTDRTLFGHVVEVMPENHIAHGILGNVHLRERRLDLATEEYRTALRIRPSYAQAYSNLGMVLEFSGRPSDAIAQYRTALRWDPGLAEAHHNLGRLLATQGETAAGIAELEAALRSNPDLVEAHLNLGVVLLGAGRRAEAIAEFRRALELRPGYAEAQRMIEKASAGQ
jgi:tetratricopeptide (TPR) repeat protein